MRGVSGAARGREVPGIDMWWKKQPKDEHLVPHRNALNAMARDLLKEAGLEFDKASPLEQALVGTFLFGMIQTHGMANKLSPPEIHALALLVFKDTLHYSDSAAAQGVQECINATDPKYHDTMHAILHRGIDGHRQYQEGDREGLSKNIVSILNQFRKRRANKITGAPTATDERLF